MDSPQAEELNRHIAGFDRLYGLEFVEIGEEEIRARVRVEDQHKQPAGLVHGGLFAAIAESIASLGTHLLVMGDGLMAVGLSNSTSFLRPITEGHVNALALRRHRGRTTMVWDVEISDDQGRNCALTRMTIAVRPAPS